MNNNYLIPANTKRGKLILSIFRPKDLIIFASGALISFLLLLIFSNQLSSIIGVILVLLPVIVCGLLVMPIPNKHNMLVFIETAYEFFANRQRYEWKGWCAFIYGQEDK